MANRKRARPKALHRDSGEGMSEADLQEVKADPEVIQAPTGFSLDARMAEVLAEQELWNDDADGRGIIAYDATEEADGVRAATDSLYPAWSDAEADTKPTSSKKRRNRRNKYKEPETAEDVRLNANQSKAHQSYPTATSEFDMAADSNTTKGCWQAKNEGSSPQPPTLKECSGLKLIPYDEKSQTATVVADANNHAVVIRAGQPWGDATWMGKTIPKVDAILKWALEEAERIKHVEIGRRGEFACYDQGVSFGGGTRVPGRLRNPAPVDRIITRVNTYHHVRRVMRFATSCFASYGPKLFVHYRDTMQELYDHHPLLRPGNFPGDMDPYVPWAASSYNLGPRVESVLHRDHGNIAYGWCAVISFGNYDYKKGGHLVLPELGVILEFPPGCVMLIPSSILKHANTPVGAGETRRSIILYSAAGLFRWVRYGFQTRTATPKAVDKRIVAEGPSRWKHACGLFSKVDELHSDREAAGLFKKQGHCSE